MGDLRSCLTSQPFLALKQMRSVQTCRGGVGPPSRAGAATFFGLYQAVSCDNTDSSGCSYLFDVTRRALTMLWYHSMKWNLADRPSPIRFASKGSLVDQWTSFEFDTDLCGAVAELACKFPSFYVCRKVHYLPNPRYMNPVCSLFLSSPF